MTSFPPSVKSPPFKLADLCEVRRDMCMPVGCSLRAGARGIALLAILATAACRLLLSEMAHGAPLAEPGASHGQISYLVFGTQENCASSLLP